MKRDPTIDVLRGVAIFTMVSANLAALVLALPHPLWLRYYGSFAAPLFIFIAGMMVAYTVRSRGYTLGHFLLRGVLIVVVGVLADIFIWKIYPFTSCDVLYLIGVSLPLAYLFLKLKPPSRWLIAGIIFLATPLLQARLGYTPYPIEIEMTALGKETCVTADLSSAFYHWVIDGWFPLFPWLGFSLLGAAAADLRWKNKILSPGKTGRTVWAGIGILAAGSIAWWAYPGSLLVRDGYSELFYPPTPGYLLSATGWILVLFSLVDRSCRATAYGPFRVLGAAPLFMYVFHLTFIEYVIAPFFYEERLSTFLPLYLSLSLLLVAVGYGLRWLRNRWKDRPLLIRFLLG